MCSVTRIEDGVYKDYSLASLGMLEPGITLCDKVYQNFIAKTEVVRTVRWCEEMKTAEHSEFFIRLMKGGYKIAAFDHTSVSHKRHYPGDYGKFRGRENYLNISKRDHGFKTRKNIKHYGKLTGEVFEDGKG